MIFPLIDRVNDALRAILPGILDQVVVVTWRWVLVAQVLYVTWRTAQRHYVTWRPPWRKSSRGTRKIALYVWYTRNDRPRYVGVSNSPGRRASQHLNGAWWCDEDIVRMEIVGWYGSRRDALAAERRMIRTLRRKHPLANVTHNRD